MEEPEMKETDNCAAFTVDFQTRPRSSKVPQRLVKYMSEQNHSSSKLSKDDLDKKQLDAEQRRKDYEKAKIDRIRECNEECHNIDAKVQILLAQDAKSHGLPGTEHIKAMSTRQAIMSIKSLAKDFSKLTPGIDYSESTTPVIDQNEILTMNTS
ncbi:uncharacterized protein LOC132550927 [Ylistrum balloti]|uniref:uncharacterized protein LOC132550927 n=1 Tax=Ylistrum balloti TaxID=509963 RepID=UPI0029059508|nr:uncharacterized protein LOC132550927 [Ylistrum balloti]